MSFARIDDLDDDDDEAAQDARPMPWWAYLIAVANFLAVGSGLAYVIFCWITGRPAR